MESRLSYSIWKEWNLKYQTNKFPKHQTNNEEQKGKCKQDFWQVFQGSGIEQMEDNLTSADPLS